MYIKDMLGREDWKRQQLRFVFRVKAEHTDYPLRSPGVLNTHQELEQCLLQERSHMFPTWQH